MWQTSRHFLLACGFACVAWEVTALQQIPDLIDGIINPDLLGGIPLGSGGFYQLASRKSLLAAVFSRRNEATMRRQVRAMWSGATTRAQELSVTSKFVVCKDEGGNDGLDDLLESEAISYGDIQLADCEEGYTNGLLARKLLSAMKIYQANFSEKDFFMKVDIDTFIDWSRLGARIVAAGTALSYMGVPLPYGESQNNLPCRNESSRWYESYDTFPDEVWPHSMAGGTGYILGKQLVKGILDEGIAEKNILNNEDRGTGVWVSKFMQKTGTAVDFITVAGTDWWDFEWGWSEEKKRALTWGQYDETLQHGLSGDAILCLTRAAMLAAPGAPIDCFNKQGKIAPPVREGCWAANEQSWLLAGAEKAAANDAAQT